MGIGTLRRYHTDTPTSPELIIECAFWVPARDGNRLFDVDPNSRAEGAMEHPRIARNRVRADAAHPSHIVLPVIS